MRRILVTLAGGVTAAVAIFLIVRSGDGPHRVVPLEQAMQEEPVAEDHTSVDALYRVGVAPSDPIGRTLDGVGEVAGASLVGSVTDEHGEAIAGAVVYARVASADEASSRSSPLSRCQTNDLGEYELPLPRREAPYDIDVGVVANGYLREARESVPVRGASSELDFVLRRGLDISGAVSDREGNPVDGVRILATRSPAFGRDSAFVTSHMRDTGSMALAPRGSDYHESRTISSRSGAFSLTGLAPGSYCVVSDDREWLWAPVDALAGEAGVGIRAFQAYGIRIVVLAEATGQPVPDPRAKLVIRGVTGSGSKRHWFADGQGRGGEVFLGWDERLSSGTIRATVDAPGFLAGTLEVPFEQPGVIECTLRLERESLCDVVVDAWLSDGQPCEVPLSVDYAASGGSAILGSAESHPEGGGRHTVQLPAGSWFVRVRRVTDVGSFGAWNGELRVVGGEHSSHLPDVTLPRLASVTVSCRGLNEGEAWTVEFRSPDFIGRLSCDASTERVTGLPPGQWVVSRVGTTAEVALAISGAGDYRVEL